MKKHTRYQGSFEKVKVIEGTGNAGRFGREAKFLAHYGARMAELLREENLTVAAVDEGVYLNAVSYQKDKAGTYLIDGIFSKRNLEMEQALEALNWQDQSD